MIEGLNADLTAEEIASTGIASGLVESLNSIKYKNRETAATQILEGAVYSAPNFTKVFEYVNAIHVADVRATEKRMLADFVRPRMATGGVEIFKALKSIASEKQYSTLQAAITTVGEAAPTAEIVAAINALKIADATT